MRETLAAGRPYKEDDEAVSKASIDEPIPRQLDAESLFFRPILDRGEMVESLPRRRSANRGHNRRREPGR